MPPGLGQASLVGRKVGGEDLVDPLEIGVGMSGLQGRQKQLVCHRAGAVWMRPGVWIWRRAGRSEDLKNAYIVCSQYFFFFCFT